MIISDVSFIIISRDEVYALTKCLESIKSLRLSNCQILCVDSGSSDNTLEVMIQYSNVIDNLSVFHIKGQSNAAVARNVGIKNACKEIIFFLDGDVEVKEDFIETALKHLRDKECEAVTGRLEEVQYSPGFDSVIHKIADRYKIKQFGRKYFSGGIFLCTRKAVNQVGLFDEALTRSQDVDYTLRLTTHFKMLEIPMSMGIHHTVPYENKGRMLESIRGQHAIYLGRCCLKNITNRKGISSLLYKYSGNSLGMLFYIILFISFSMSSMYTLAILFIPIADISFGLCQKKQISYRILSHYINPLFILKGFMFFNKKIPNYASTTIVVSTDD